MRGSPSRQTRRALKRVERLRTLTIRAGVAVLLAASGSARTAENRPAPLALEALKQMTLETLMDVEVTSASKTAEPLLQAATAIHVVTQDDLRRSGATSLAEALRGIPGVEVARVNSHQWAVTARGFNDAGSSPRHQFALRSSVDLGRHVDLDGTLRYVDQLTAYAVPGYVEMDVRLAWRPREGVELALVGQNLLHDRHPEYAPSFLRFEGTEVQRGVYAKLTLRF